MRIILKVTAGAAAGQVFRFDRHDTFLVGRSKHTHLRLPPSDRTCSRFHFMIEVNPPHCRLMDMGSNNGTYVNDQRVSVADLQHGDKIRAGRNILRIGVQARENEPPAPAPAEAARPAAATAETVGLPEAIPLSKSLLPDAVVPEAVPLGALSPPPVQPARHAAPPTARPGPPAAVPPQPETVATAAGAAERTQPDARATAPPEPAKAVARGPTVAGYRLREKLGEGHMGVVYLAESSGGELAALKMIRKAADLTQNDVERFLREAAIVRELRHPHIVGFRDSGAHEGRPYFVMDYVPGRDAGALVKEQGPMATARAAALACQLLEALEYAHARRFVHRDIKPSNLLVYQEGGRELLKLADFGLARVYQASNFSGLTMDGHIGGTPSFMAPEQLLNFRDAPPSADQYSAAATLYYLLTGKFAHDLPREMHLVFARILNDDPVPVRQRRPDLPAGLAEATDRALRRDPAKRFADVASLRRALERFRQTGT
jgi:serine/threonine-protein kinase